MLSLYEVSNEPNSFRYTGFSIDNLQISQFLSLPEAVVERLCLRGDPVNVFYKVLWSEHLKDGG